MGPPASRRDGKTTPGATRKGQRGTRRTPALVPVRISTEPSAPSTFELVFRGNDRVLRIPSQFDEARLTALLGVLHKTC
jgi:hypothetical protein